MEAYRENLIVIVEEYRENLIVIVEEYRQDNLIVIVEVDGEETWRRTKCMYLRCKKYKMHRAGQQRYGQTKKRLNNLG